MGANFKRYGPRGHAENVTAHRIEPLHNLAVCMLTLRDDQVEQSDRSSWPRGGVEAVDEIYIQSTEILGQETMRPGGVPHTGKIFLWPHQRERS